MNVSAHFTHAILQKIIIRLLAASAICAVMLSGALAGGSGHSHTVPPGTAGMKIYINPETGKAEAPPADVAAPALSPAEQNAMSTSHDGLEEEASSVPGGGVKVNLQGRFLSPLTATIDSTGKVIIRHIHTTPTTK